MKRALLSAALAVSLVTICAHAQVASPTTPTSPTAPNNPVDPNGAATEAPTPPTFPQEQNAPPPTAISPDQSTQGDNQSGTTANDASQQNEPASTGPHQATDKVNYRLLIQRAMEQHAGLHDVMVNIPDDTSIDLSGHVQTEADKITAGKIAQSYAHGRKVVNQVEVVQD